MLVHLSVRDYLLIESVELSFGRGLCVLTGETGAGKSVLVGALQLLVGERAKADAIRDGADEAEIAAQFVLAGQMLHDVEARLEQEGLRRCDDGALVLRRLLTKSGKSRQFINGTMVTVAQLKAVTRGLVDFTGQHAQQQLRDRTHQRRLLDSYGGHHAAARAVAAAYDEAQQAAAELAALRDKASDAADQIEYLRYQIEEIEKLDPRPGEDETLEAERTRLVNAERFEGAIAEALSLVQGDLDAVGALQRAAHRLHDAARHDTELSDIAARLEEAACLADDAARDLSRAADHIEHNPARLAEVDERFFELKRLMRKHGGDLDAVIAARARLNQELSDLEDFDSTLAGLEQAFDKARQALVKAMRTLSARRKATAKKLAPKVTAELASLAMTDATFSVTFEDETFLPFSDEVRGSRDGAERVELVLSAGPGQPEGPLAKSASGGELSRVLLALKRVLLERDPAPVSLFDEVDTGVGGAVADTIGEKLRALGADRQVLCVTHLAQIAALADHHYVVEKGVADQRAVTRVDKLTEAARVDEVARMVSGKSVTKTTRSHAKELLARREKRAAAS